MLVLACADFVLICFDAVFDHEEENETMGFFFFFSFLHASRII
jgi:hypothetical protein